MGTTLVIGATGKVGREVVSHLVARGEQVLAATRNPAAASLPAGATAVRVFLDRQEDLRNALAGADRLFMLAPEDDIEPDTTVARVVEAGTASGLGAIVLMTVMGVEGSDNAYVRAERVVSDSGLRHTFIRPNWFMQNFSVGLFAESIRQTGHIYLPAADARVSFVDTRDIAAVAVAALTEDGHGGNAYTVTGGQSMSHSEVADIVSGVSGRPVAYTAISDDDLRAALAEDGTPQPLIEHLVSFFPPMRDGLYEPVSRDASAVLGRPPLTFEQHAREFADCWRSERSAHT